MTSLVKIFRKHIRFQPNKARRFPNKAENFMIIENSLISLTSNMAQPSPTASGTITPTPAVNLEGLDFGHPSPIYPRPFKSAPAKPRHPRRNKNLKQILQDEQKALAAQAAEAADPTANGNSTKA